MLQSQIELTLFGEPMLLLMLPLSLPKVQPKGSTDTAKKMMGYRAQQPARQAAVDTYDDYEIEFSDDEDDNIIIEAEPADRGYSHGERHNHRAPCHLKISAFVNRPRVYCHTYYVHLCIQN